MKKREIKGEKNSFIVKNVSEPALVHSGTRTCLMLAYSLNAKFPAFLRPFSITGKLANGLCVNIIASILTS